MEEIYQKAEQAKSFASLVNYPRLLWRWQFKYSEDLMRIAKLCSHKLGKHKWCKDKNECLIIDEFISKNTIKKTLYE